MRLTIAVCLGVAAAVVCVRPLAAAPFTGKPPMIGIESIVPKAVALDAQGAKYVTGIFYQIADFNPGAGLQNRTATSTGGTPFVTKFDAAGAWVWTETFGGTGTDQPAAITVAGGVVYVVGTFDSNDFGFGQTGTISSNTDATNFGAGFVAALDAATGLPKSTFHGAAGANTFGGSGGGRAAATCVTVDGSILYVGGTFSASGFGIGGSGSTGSTGQTDGFVAALDVRSGEPVLTFGSLGLQTFGGNGNENIRGLAAANGRLYVGGDTSSTDFGVGGTGTVSTPALYDVDAFVAALDVTTGARVAAFGGDGIVTFGGTGTEEGSAVAAYGGSVYLAGTVDGADARIDGAGAAHPTFGGRDVFVLAVDAATGAPVTAFAGGLRTFGGAKDEGRPVAVVATASTVYVAGALGTADAGIGGAGAVEQADSFVLALDRATGGARAGFAGDGVQTLNGGDPSGVHQVATIAGFAVSSAGLVLVGAAPVGAYFGPPQFKAKFPGTGAYLLLLDAANGDALNLTGANRRPVFGTPILATPNPAVAGKPVAFRAVVTDPDHNPVHLHWAFGDGSTSSSKSPKKTFAAAGTYKVTVTADDGKGGETAGAGLDFVVHAAGAPYFDVTKATVALKFSAPGNDVVTAAGQFPLADGTSLAGKSITVDVGGASQAFAVDVTGKSVSPDASVFVTPPKNGVAKFTAKILHGDFADAFLDEHMTNATVKARYVPTVVTVIFDGTTYAETMPLFWSAKLGKSGTAK